MAISCSKTKKPEAISLFNGENLRWLDYLWN